MSGIAKDGLARWHGIVGKMTDETLDAMLADNVVFHSPVVHTPQEGKALTKLYLMAAFNVMPGDAAASAPNDAPASLSKPGSKFRYVREVVGDRDAILEFVTEIDGITVNGVDMIRWNEAGLIEDFKVMIRPLKAIQTIHAQMGRMLEAMKPG
ncbi:MAG: nuclear transport factor 2 family protein [Myxococcota bacterium]